MAKFPKSITCMLCGKVYDKFDEYDKHIRIEHGINKLNEKIMDVVSTKYEVVRNYKSALFKCDFYIPQADLIVELFPSSPVMKMKCVEFEKPYMEIHSAVSEEDIIRQVERVMYGLDPTIVYTENECRIDVDSVTNNAGKPTLRSKTNRLIYKYQPTFFETENDLWIHDPVKRRCLIENRKKYLCRDEYQITERELLSGMKISGICKGYSHFNPFLLKWVIDEYFYGKDTDLYLPCCGWGHKLLVGGCVHSLYACDNNDKIMNGLHDIVKFCNFENNIVEYKDASEITYQKSNATFICPPYYNTEIYKNRYKTYSEYIDFIHRLLKKSFDESSSRKLGIVIDGKNIKPILDLYPNAVVIDLENSKNHFTSVKNNNEYFIYCEK